MSEMKLQEKTRGFNIIAKPIGPVCNMNCHYCFYSEKSSLYQEKQSLHMTDEVLETFIRKYIQSQDNPEVQFVWQGGEPTLMGLDFYSKVVMLQNKYAGNKRIMNSIQTNGILLDDDWCKFLKRYGFLVGLSMDGPEMVHDRFRVGRSGRPTFQKVKKGMELLKKYQVPFNVLVCVTKDSSKSSLEIYKYFKENGVKYIQFSPIVERVPADSDRDLGLKHASPASLCGTENQVKVSSYTVDPLDYGEFLIQIFDEWVKEDVGSIHVMNFEWALEAWLGLPATYCFFSRQCGNAVAIEHNGDIYSCDHYVYPDYKLGNITADMPEDIVKSVLQLEFGRKKRVNLPQWCKSCDVLFACNGECPKNRFINTVDGEPGLNYLCEGYKNYFHHIHPYMKVMVQLIEIGQPAARVMEVIKGPLAI